MSWRYWETKDGRRFCFSTAPRFTCAFAEEPPATMVEFASQIGLDGARVIALWRRGHRGTSHRARVGDRLTDRCEACGAKMESHGFSAWVERDREGDDSAMRIADRLGMRPPAERVKFVEGLSRRDAKRWAYDEYEIAKAALDAAG